MKTLLHDTIDIAIDFLTSEINKTPETDKASNAHKILLSMCKKVITELKDENEHLREKIEQNQRYAQIGEKAVSLIALIKDVHPDD